MKAFRCKICDTGYTTTGDEAPPSPKWADGHVCIMKEVKSKLNDVTKRIPIELEDESEERMKVIGQNGNTGEHYDEESR